MKICSSGRHSTGRTLLYLVLFVLALLHGRAALAQEDNYRYQNLWDLAAGLSYLNTPTGPHIPWHAQLGGADVSGTQWLTPRWGATGDVRFYYGPGNVAPTPYGVNSPLAADLQYMGGGEYRWLRSSSVGVNLRALAGGAYGNFDGHVPSGVTNADLGLYPNGNTFSLLAGPVLDFHRSTSYSIRIVPAYNATHFGGEFQSNFSLSAQIVLHYGKF